MTESKGVLVDLEVVDVLRTLEARIAQRGGDPGLVLRGLLDFDVADDVVDVLMGRSDDCGDSEILEALEPLKKGIIARGGDVEDALDKLSYRNVVDQIVDVLLRGDDEEEEEEEEPLFRLGEMNQVKP